jgi:hypothetical protein
MLQTTAVERKHELAAQFNALSPSSFHSALHSSSGRSLLSASGGGRTLLAFGSSFPAPDLSFTYADEGVSFSLPLNCNTAKLAKGGNCAQLLVNLEN